MPRVELRHIEVRPRNPLAGWPQKAHLVTAVLLAADLLIVCLRTCATGHFLRTSRWAEALLVLLAAASTLMSLCRELPAQNVVFAAVLIGLASGAAQAINAIAGVPFGPIEYYPEKAGHFLIAGLPWPIPVIWVVVLLNSRGVARLIMRSRRHSPHYGLWVMGLTAMLVVVFELSFQPYATQIKNYWSWKPTKLPSSWYTTPWTNFLGCSVVSLLILLFVTPVLINKSPRQRPSYYYPVLVWELLGLLLLTATAHGHLWGASGLILVQMAVVAVLCIAAAKRRGNQGG
jgi:uncharacterized membrane protein